MARHPRRNNRKPPKPPPTAPPPLQGGPPPPAAPAIAEDDDPNTTTYVVLVALLVLFLLLLLFMFGLSGRGSGGGSGGGAGVARGDGVAEGGGEDSGSDARGDAQGEESFEESGVQGDLRSDAPGDHVAGAIEAADNPTPMESDLPDATEDEAHESQVQVVEEEGAVLSPETEEQEQGTLLADVEPETIDNNRNQFFIEGDSAQSPEERAPALAGRTAVARERLARSGGGNQESERAVDLALKWLAEHQMEDGGWSFDHTQGDCGGRCSVPGVLRNGRNGATAMALLPFLGAGETHRNGKYQNVVERGLDFLVRGLGEAQQGMSLYDGGRMYSHGLATIALTEAYAMTGDTKLQEPAQQAIDFIVYAQDPDGGGWRYDVQAGGDTSVVGWQVIALKSAKLGALNVEQTVFDKAEDFLVGVQMDEGAFYGYVSPEKKPSTSAIGLLCRMYLGWPRDHPSLRAGVRAIADYGPSDRDMYYNYYAAQLMFQFTRGRGSDWRRWNKRLRDYIVSNQAQAGHEEGSWVFQDPHGSGGGRLYCTSLATLILEVYYRHMPIFQDTAAKR